jgi:hypothetical protein
LCMYLLPKPCTSQAVTSFVHRFLPLSKHGRNEGLEIHFGSRTNDTPTYSYFYV